MKTNDQQLSQVINIYHTNVGGKNYYIKISSDIRKSMLLSV